MMNKKRKLIVVVVLLLIISIVSINNSRTEEWMNFRTLNDAKVSVRATANFDLTQNYRIKVYYKAKGEWFYNKSLETRMIRDHRGPLEISPDELDYEIVDNKFNIIMHQDNTITKTISIDINTGECEVSVPNKDEKID